MPHAVIHVDVTPLPNEPPEALTLEICYFINTVPMHTWAGLAVINVSLTEQPPPASTAGAAEGIEQVLTRASVEARAGSTNISTSAAQLDGPSAGLLELLCLGVREVASEWQVDPPNPHSSKAAGEVFSYDNERIVLQEVQVPSSSLQSHINGVIQTNEPSGRKGRWLFHGHRHAVPGTIRDGILTQEADTFNAIPTSDVNKQGRVLDGYLEEIHFFRSPKQNSIFIPGSEVHMEAAQSSSH